MEQWFLFRADRQYGPYTWADILQMARSGGIEATDVLWRQTDDRHIWAGEVPGLLPQAIRPAQKNATKNRPVLIGANAFLALLLVLALVLLVLPPFSQDPSEPTKPTDGTTRIEENPAPAVTIDHPSGLRLDAPEGSFHAATILTVAVETEAPSAEPFQTEGLTYVIDGMALDNGRKPVTVDLPAADDQQVVLFFQLGRWIRIPSTAGVNVSGQPVRRVTLDGLPLPWILTVARLPDAGESGPDLVMSGSRARLLARLEQLRITDRHAYRDELGLLLVNDALVTPEKDPEPGVYPVSATPQRSLKLVEDHLEDAKAAFFKAESWAANDIRALESYLEGLKSLWLARQTLLAMRPEDRLISYDDRTDSRGIYGGKLSLIDMVQVYCATFAPWGLELTLRLLEEENNWHLESFHLGVLEFYGQLPFIDLPLPGGKQPVPVRTQAEGLDEAGRYPHQYIVNLEENQRKLAAELRIIEGEALTYSVLRLYATRLNRMSGQEMLVWAKHAKNGLSSLKGIALLFKGIPPAAGLVGSAWLLFSIMSPFVELIFEYIDPYDPLAGLDQQGGYITRDGAVTLYQAGKMIGSLIHHAASADDGSLAGFYGKAGLITLGGLTEMALSQVMDKDALVELKTLRQASGTIAGYRDPGAWFWQSGQSFVPPILVLTTVCGPTDDRPHEKSRHRPPGPEGSYITGVEGQIILALIYNRIGTADYAKSLEQGSPNELTQSIDARLRSDVAYGSHLLLFSQTRSDEIRHVDNGPDFQAIHWSVEEETLMQWARSADLKNVTELLRRVVVEVYAGEPTGTPDPASRLRFLDQQQGGADNNALHWHQIESETDGLFSFVLAVSAERRPFNRQEVSRFTEHEVGQWFSVPWYSRTITAANTGFLALSYTVRLRLDEVVLADYPVYFNRLAAPGTTLVRYAGPDTISTPGYLWGSWQEKVDQFMVEIAMVQPPEDCPGTYSGMIKLATPELADFGLAQLEMTLTLTIDQDGNAEMVWVYDDQMRIPIAPGMSIRLEWLNEALLSGQCRAGQISLQGETWTNITQRSPNPMKPEEELVQTLESRGDAVVTATLQGDTVQGTLTTSDKTHSYEQTFTLTRQN